MSVLIYRNMLNGDMRRFSRISRKIVNGNQGLRVTVNYEPKKIKFLYDIETHDTIIIFSHGSYDSIYHRFNTSDTTKIQTLIDNSNMDVLIDKKVIAISCGSAKSLGILAIAYGCKAYLGFKGRIHYGIKGTHKVPSNKYHQFLKRCYKDTFEEIITEAIKFNWTFGKLEIVLGIALNNRVITELQKLLEERGVKYYYKYKFDMSVVAVAKVVDNIVLHGSKQVTVG
jgi:hypothetical protein